MDTQWFLTRDGETIAQYSTEQFKRAVAKGRLRPADYVRRSDSSSQISASEFLPSTYKPRSAVPRVLAGIVAVAAALAAIGYGVGEFAPAYLQTALQNLEKLKTGASPQSAIKQAALRQMLLSDSVAGGFFAKLEEKDPAAFEELISQFANEAPEEAIPKVRAYLMKTVVEPRSRYLADDDKAAMLTLNRDISLQLAGTNPKMCLAHALAKPFGDPAPFTTPELQAREQQLMVKILDAEPQTFDLLPAPELQAINSKVGTELYKAHGDEINLLDLESVPDGKDEAACRMFAAYLDGVLTLPEAERVALVRAMMLEPALLSEDTSATATPAGEAAPAAEATAAEPQQPIVAAPAEADAPEPSADANAEPPAADPDAGADTQAQQ